MTNSRNNSKSNSVYNFFAEVFSSEKFFAKIGNYIFSYCVGIAIGVLILLGIGKSIDWYNAIKAKKEAERKAEEERKRKEEEREDLGKLKEIYDEYFNSRIVGKVYKNLREVEDQFENKVWKEFRQESHFRKLTDQDFNNFRNKVIEFRKKLERVYNF